MHTLFFYLPSLTSQNYLEIDLCSVIYQKFIFLIDILVSYCMDIISLFHLLVEIWVMSNRKPL